MAGNPQPVNRPPDEKEADIMRAIAVADAADWLGCSHETVADALDRLSAAGRVRFTGDSLTAAITVGGHRLIEAPRDWLYFRAAMEGGSNAE